MLPDIRAVIAAIVAAVGLLMISFGLVATFRVAQEDRSGSLQAGLAERGRSQAPDNTEPRAILIIDTPAPAPRAGAPVAESAMPAEISLTPVAAIETPASPVAVLAAPQAASPSAEPPMGGPLHAAAVQAETPPRGAAAETAIMTDEKAAEKESTKKARAARMVRERKAAARRAAQARRAKENPAAPFGSFGGTFTR